MQTTALISGSSGDTSPETSGSIGHPASGSTRNLGPDGQVKLFKKDSTLALLEAKSAGLLDVFTYLHCDRLGEVRTSVTQFAMNILNLDVSFLMFFNTEVLSVQKTDSCNGICSSFLYNLSILLAITAAINSIRGMMIAFKGATGAFPIIKGTMRLPTDTLQQQIGHGSIPFLARICKVMDLSRSNFPKGERF